ncbi:MAG: hypothetical protein GX422_15580 [Deltaproteobacteria bacterium]|nr:hypothetical protein [Deltaproteobacteria bacterium]
MDDVSFHKILSFFSLSRQGYRKVRKGVKKRLIRHMEALGLHCIDDYLLFLSRDPREEKKARQSLTVSISRFFRDRLLWEVLRTIVLPDLALAAPEMLRIWCAGCASGEEVYSLRILWNEMTEVDSGLPPMEIWATDLNPVLVERAKEGEYQPGSLKEVQPELREKYFIHRGDLLCVRDSLKKGIHWQCSDVVQDPPPAGIFNLVFLRNSLFTYYEQHVQVTVIPRILDRIPWGGYVVVGNNETIPPVDIPVAPHPAYRCILQKKRPDGPDITSRSHPKRALHREGCKSVIKSLAKDLAISILRRVFKWRDEQEVVDG